MGDVFEKSVGWVETPELPKSTILGGAEKPEDAQKQKVYAIDCEMVCLSIYLFCEYLSALIFPVSHRGWEGTNEGLPDRFSFRSRCVRPVGEASQTRD